MKSLRMKWLAFIFVASIIAACGGGGGGEDPNPTPPPGTGEGEKTAPVLLTVGNPHSGAIGTAGVSYYYFNTGATSGSYTISLTNTDKTLGWQLYSDADFTTLVDSCMEYVSGDKFCFATLDAGVNYYLQVSSFSFSGGTYTVTVETGGGSEGAVGNPVALTVGTPYTASIAYPGDSYYSFTPASTGSFIIGLSDTNTDLGWSLYSDINYTTYLSAASTCDVNWNNDGEICSTPNLTSGTTYYLQVHNGGYSDDMFTILINAGKSEGSVSNPVMLTVGSPHIGAVDGSEASSMTVGVSYYQFTTDASATSSYTIALTDIQPSATGMKVLAYSDAGFTNTLPDCFSASESCSPQNLSPNTTYYVAVQNEYDYVNGVPARTYTLTVTKGGSEGSTTNPVDITVGKLHSGGVDASGESYYRFTTNSGSGGSYTVSLVNTQANVGWMLYRDASFSSGVHSCNTVQTTGPGDESCVTTNLDANTTYYLNVTNYEGSPSTYSLTVAAGGGSEGSRNHPFVLPIDAAHDGSVLGWGYSYYTFTTGSSPISYQISLKNMQEDLNWDLLSGADFSGWVTWCSNQSTAADEVCSTPVLSASTTYYLRVNSSGANFSTYTIHIMSLDPATGCSGSAAECFHFEDGLLPASFVLTAPGNKFTQWQIDSANSAATNGAFSLRSGSIDSDQSTCFEYSRTADTNTVLFSLKTSTEYSDQLHFFIDGIEQYGPWGGDIPWMRVLFYPTAGPHTYTWCYTKNWSTVSGADAVWVDDIEFR